ncbi:hypothetical protein VFPBJ_08845 [Purpureocillium lilacinum]|nr:hypothetical protein VFPBJ_08845 [Purpureocillium lilacinum]
MPCRNPWASRDLRPVFFYRDAKGSIALLEHAPIGRPSDWEIHAWIKHNRMHVWACAWAAQQRSGSVGSPRRCPLCSSRRLTDSSDAPELSPQRLAPVGDGQEPSAKSLLGGPLAPRTCGILLGEWLGVMRLGPTPDPHRHHEEWRAAEHQPSSP